MRNRRKLVTILMAGMLCGFLIEVSAQDSGVELGKGTIPKDVVRGSRIFAAGEYDFRLMPGDNGHISFSYRDEESGLEYGFGAATEVTDSKENHPEPNLDIELVEIEDIEYVQITAYYLDKKYKVLMEVDEE